MERLKVRKNEVNTYIEELINEYNSRINDGETRYLTMKCLRKEIAERRKSLNQKR